MAIKRKGVWDIDFQINNKKIKNNLNAVGGEVRKLNKDLKKLTPETEEFIRKSADLEKAENQFKKIKAEIKGTTSQLSKVKGALKPLGTLLLASFSIGAVVTFFRTIGTNINVLRKLKGAISQITDLNGEALDQTTAKVKALSETFDADSKKMTEAAQNLSQQMGIDFSEALNLIKQGYLDGADANGDFLDKVREYPALLSEAGLTAQQSISLMSQEIKQGIYSDKGVDAIKEANLRLREMTPTAVTALDAIGISSSELQKELTSGSITTFDAIQRVSAKLDTLPPQSKEVGQAIADIFGGAGEDAGLKYLSNLHKIDLTSNSLIDTTNDYVRAKEAELKANENLNNVWVKLTGTGSALNSAYTKLKSGIASLLAPLVGVKNQAIETKNAFEDQAKKVDALNKTLTPLTKEYQDLMKEGKLSESQQARLKEVIKEIGNILPTVISDFDSYGDALTVSTKKTKELLEAEKEKLKNLKEITIATQKQTLAENEKNLQRINAKLNTKNEEGSLVKKRATGVTTFSTNKNVYSTNVKLSSSEIQGLRDEKKRLQESLDNTNDYLEKNDETNKKYAERLAERQKKANENRKNLIKKAQDLSIKNAAEFSDQQLQIEITNVESVNNQKLIKNKEASEIRATENKKAAIKIAAEKKRAFEKGNQDLNIVIKKLQDNKLLESKKGIEKELLIIDQKFAAIKSKFILSKKQEEELKAKDPEKLAEYHEKLAEIDKIARTKKEDLKIANEEILKEEADATKILEEENKIEQEIIDAGSEEEKIALLISKTRWIANTQLKIERDAAIARLKLNNATEESIAAVKKKYGLKIENVEIAFLKAKKKAEEDSKKAKSQRLIAQFKEAAQFSEDIRSLVGKDTVAGKAAGIAIATINTAKGIAEIWGRQSVLPEPFGTAAKVASTIVAAKSGLNAVNAIRNTDTSFYEGGPTGNKALYNDKYGSVVGVVHEDEWVAPKFMTESNRYAPTIRWLEKERKQELGEFFEGGITSSEDNVNLENENENEIEIPQNKNSLELISAINRLNENLEKGIQSYSIADYEEFLQRKEQDKEFQEIFNNTRLFL